MNSFAKEVVCSHKEFCESVIQPRVVKCALDFYQEEDESIGTGSYLHECIAREIRRICKETGLQPFGEFQSPKTRDPNDKRKGRVDVMVADLKSNTIAFVFEIDKGIKTGSIEKLKFYPWDVGKCLVSYGKRIPSSKIKLLNSDICLIDITKETLSKNLK